MSNSARRRKSTLIDRIAESSRPHVDDSTPTERSAWWWVFFMPGKVILWIEYMFPRRVGGVFGSARRRNVPLLQILYSVGFYLVVLLFLFSVFAH